MARVLSSISFDAPASPVSANVDDTFAFSGTPGFAGGGGVQRYDFRWEVDDGGGYVAIGASGTGLITADTNPLVNTNSSNQNSITVACESGGSYTIRMVGAPTSGGSYTVASSTQTVEVSSGPTTFNQAITATAVGVTAIATLATHSRALAATAVGVVSLAPLSTFFRALAATAIGAAALNKASIFVRSLASTAVGAAAITSASVIGKTLTATATGVASMTAKIVAGVSMAATAVGSAALQALSVITQAVSAAVTGVASLVAEFIEGDGVIANALKLVVNMTQSIGAWKAKGKGK